MERLGRSYYGKGPIWKTAEGASVSPVALRESVAWREETYLENSGRRSYGKRSIRRDQEEAINGRDLFGEQRKGVGDKGLRLG